MFILYPDYIFHRIYDIPTSFFADRGITTLLLDVDNTLTTDNNPQPHAKVTRWLEEQHKAGLRLMVLSNNYRKRVEPFANSLGLEFIAMAAKPLPYNLRRALSQMNVPVSKAALIGDQIFTDVCCGRLAKCTAILVEPMAMEDNIFHRMKRRLEQPLLRAYRKKQKGEQKDGQ